MGKKSKKGATKPVKSNDFPKDAHGYPKYEQLPARMIPDEPYVVPEEYMDPLLYSLLKPSRIHGVRQDLRDADVLRAHLEDVFSVDRVLTELMVKPLIQGLVNGGEDINWLVQVDHSENRFSLLAMVCQWRCFSRHNGWGGKSEMVRMVLATPGIQINQKMPNLTNAAFFCVKYADVETFQMVIDAGCDLSQKDFQGRTMLSNALDYPNPDILRLVLKHVPATELFPLINNDFEQFTGKYIHYSGPDCIIELYSTKVNLDQTTKARQKGSLSWNIMGGPPPMEGVAECLIMLRQKGATFATASFAETRSLWQCLDYAFAGGTVLKLAPPTEIIRLGESIMGLWLPKRVEDEMRASDELELETKTPRVSGECTICSAPFTKPSTLYCGHTFCRECIVESGKQDPQCPLCRRLLCLDIAPDRDESADLPASGVSNEGNIDSKISTRQSAFMKSFDYLSDRQVKEETVYQGALLSANKELSLLENLKNLIMHSHLHAMSSPTRDRQFFSKEENQNRRECSLPHLELSATHSIIGDNLTIYHPMKGPACVEIKVKGVPVVAHISNNSRYTIISSAFVNTFGLKRVEGLTTKKLRCGLSSKKLTDASATCLEDFNFTIGEVNVSLRNAVEVDGGEENKFGVQLGQDFFLSAAYCAATVEAFGEDGDIDDVPPYMIVDGFHQWTTSNCPKTESLRYYAYDGKTAHVPLLHLNPHKNGKVNFITLRPDAALDECSYCSRTFPKGMRKCTCGSKYCDERCQRASWGIHKRNRHSQE
jgi:hypothetical protein